MVRDLAFSKKVRYKTEETEIGHNGGSAVINPNPKPYPNHPMQSSAVFRRTAIMVLPELIQNKNINNKVNKYERKMKQDFISVTQLHKQCCKMSGNGGRVTCGSYTAT